MDSRNTGQKKYGLIIPSKKGARIAFGSALTSSEPKPKVFCTESSSDDDLDGDEETGKNPLDWRSRTVAKAAEKSMQRNQARQAALKALAEDPTVFQYDELYDEMEQKRTEQKPAKQEKKPKYIANLMKSAEDRKLENERRTERKVQKERELEGDKFQDKESFVTPAYRAKLAELKKAEEEERQKEKLEELLDVRKQNDLSGFYRHLYNQTFAEKAEPAEVKKEEETSTKASSSRTEPSVQKSEEQKVRRQYRQRREESPEPGPVEPEKKEKEASESSEHDSDEAAEPNKRETLHELAKRRPEASAALVAAAASDREAVASRSTKGADQTKKDSVASLCPDKREVSRKDVKRRETKSPESDDNRTSSPQPTRKQSEAKENVKPKAKVDIWKKRNTGELFEAALARYLLRKEARENGLIPWP